MEVSTRGWKLSITSAQTRPYISPQERSQAARNMVASPLVELTQEGGYLGFAWKSQAAIQEEPFFLCMFDKGNLVEGVACSCHNRKPLNHEGRESHLYGCTFLKFR